MRNKVDFVIVNDTAKPKTGGDYVYYVMKNELVSQGYEVNEISVPQAVDFLRRAHRPDWIGRAAFSFSELSAYMLCYLSSIEKFKSHSRVVITSSCPTFPVLGHLTYHQPKAGIFARSFNESGSLKRVIGYRVEENEKLSPLWFFAKKLMRLHLSNSLFTKEIVKRMYGVESCVLYPPVPTHKYYHPIDGGKRERYVLLTRSEATTGVSSLSIIGRQMPKDIKLVIIGNIDHAGMVALKNLKAQGANFAYLGFVSEESKIEIFRKCSVYLNLAVNETFGISVIEALASGCIPLAHRSGAIPEYLPEELCFSDYEEIAEKVVTYIDSPSDLRERLKGIALRFDESIFRRNFMLSFHRLENSLEMMSFNNA
ncbi:MAG: glycosyltransferase family 4 protein [Candidatus Bathyarchaeia archaeon]